MLTGWDCQTGGEWLTVDLRFMVERESDSGVLEPDSAPCEGAWRGAYLDDSLRALIGWFLTLDEAPAVLGGHPVRLLPATQEGVAGHLIIQDRS
jgi:hypothetical protein